MSYALVILATLICAPVAYLIMYNLWVWAFFAGMGRRVTEGYTPGGRLVSEGQRWNLKEDIHDELRGGIYIIREWYGDRILLIREDGGRDGLPPGALPIFDLPIMDDLKFELVEDVKI